MTRSTVQFDGANYDYGSGPLSILAAGAAAGGVLEGTYPNPGLAHAVAGTGLTESSDVLAVAYGTSSTTACVGNDSRLSDARTPTGSAGGDLTGTFPNPTLVTSGVTAATYGDSTHVAQVAVDAKGRITSASSVAISASSAITQSYVGYNTAGGTTDAVAAANYKQVLKSVTLAASGLLVSIDAYVKGNNSNVQTLLGCVLDDNAGVPGKVVGILAGETAGSSTVLNLVLSTTARWLSVPMSLWLPAGTYWLGILTGNAMTLHYDSSGGDYTATGAVTWLNETAGGSFSNSSRKYSIRGSVIS